jgi:hypothetical protein
MIFDTIQVFIVEKSHSLIASFTGAATTTALSWSLDLLSRCIVGLIVGVGTWLITHAISAAIQKNKDNKKL